MEKKNKIIIISIISVVVLLAISVTIFLVIKMKNTKIIEGNTDNGWAQVNGNGLNSFLENNFSPDALVGIRKDSLKILGEVKKQAYSSDYKAIYAKDESSVYMRSLCNERAPFVKIIGANPDTFVVLDYCYSKDKNNAYFINKVIAGVDLNTFSVIESNYSKDDKSVYFQRHRIDEVDLDSFKITLNSREKGYYSRDKNNFYKGYLKVGRFNKDKNTKPTDGVVDCSNENIDSNSFEVVNSNFVKDKNGVYFFVKSAGGIDYCDRVDGANPLSFEAISNNWAMDIDSIFYKAKILDSLNINKDTFEVVNDNFAKDDDNVYFQEEVIPEANPETFVELSDNYGKDDENVYFEEEVVVGANPETVEVINDDNSNDSHFIKDDEAVYTEDEEIEDINPETFDLVEYTQEEKALACFSEEMKANIDINLFALVGSCHAKDADHVFFKPDCSQVCPYSEMVADVASFEEIKYNYSKDKNDVYYLGYKINGLDKQTFQLFDDTINYSKDKNNVYFGANVIDGADVNTFKVISDSFASGHWGQDKDSLYKGTERVEDDNLDISDDFSNTQSGENCYFKKGTGAYVEKHCPVR